MDTGPPSGEKRVQGGIALPTQGAHHGQTRTLHVWAACNMNGFWSHKKARDLHVITCFSGRTVPKVSENKVLKKRG